MNLEPLGRADLPVPAAQLARWLIGKTLVRDDPDGRMMGRVVETQAYVIGDASSHAFRGKTARNASMISLAGRPEAILLPVSIAGHDIVDLLDRQLLDRDPPAGRQRWLHRSPSSGNALSERYAPSLTTSTSATGGAKGYRAHIVEPGSYRRSIAANTSHRVHRTMESVHQRGKTALLVSLVAMPQQSYADLLPGSHTSAD